MESVGNATTKLDCITDINGKQCELNGNEHTDDAMCILYDTADMHEKIIYDFSVAIDSDVTDGIVHAGVYVSAGNTAVGHDGASVSTVDTAIGHDGEYVSAVDEIIFHAGECVIAGCTVIGYADAFVDFFIDAVSGTDLYAASFIKDVCRRGRSQDFPKELPDITESRAAERSENIHHRWVQRSSRQFEAVGP